MPNSEYRKLPLASLVESPTNPRKTFGDEALRELAQSIQAQGLLQPILVRPLGDQYEVVCGARRFRACSLAGLTKIDCRVVDMSDEQVIDAQIVENLQREDVHPLEEAACIKGLLDTNLYDSAQVVADKIGRPVKFVLRRLKLLDLRSELVEALQSGEVSIGWAELAATLSLGEQVEALADARSSWGHKGVSGLRGWMSRRWRPLTNPLWKLDDAKLLPQAGACSTCPKNSDNGLFPEEGKPACSDPECFEMKRQAVFARKLAERQNRHPELKLIGASDSKIPGVLRQAFDVAVVNQSKPNDTFPHVGILAERLWLGSEVGDIVAYRLIDRESLYPGGEDSPSVPGQRTDRKAEIKAMRLEARYRYRLYEALVDALKVGYPKTEIASPVSDLLIHLCRNAQNAPAGGVTLLPPTGFEAAKECWGGDRPENGGDLFRGLSPCDQLLVAFTEAANHECKYHDYHKPEPHVLDAFAERFGIDREHIRREAEIELMTKKERKEAGL